MTFTSTKSFLSNRVIICLEVIIIILFSLGKADPIGYTVDTLDAEAFYLEDMKTGRVIIQKNQSKLLSAASTTKLVTAIVASRLLKTREIITVPRSAAQIEPTKAYLRRGERYYFIDLLKAMIIKSANDASLAVAIHSSKTEKKFVRLMNNWCRKNRIINTNFSDVCGLSPYSVSTARDLSKIYRNFIKDAQNFRILKRKYCSIRSLSGRKINLKNSNNLYRIRPEQYGKLIGKTGFTRKAGYCFAGQVNYKKRSYILIVISAKMAWHQIHILMNYANELYDEGKL